MQTDDNTLSRLRDADVTVYRTDMQGTIVCTSDGSAVCFSTERNATTQTNPTAQPAPLTPPVVSGRNSQPAQGITYIGNINTKKFHFPTCSGLPLEKNRTYFDSREEAISAGYSPCGICKP